MSALEQEIAEIRELLNQLIAARRECNDPSVLSEINRAISRAMARWNSAYNRK